MTRKYPQGPLKMVRAAKVDEETRALSRALLRVEAAEREAERLASEQQMLERSIAEETSVEQRLL
ncbi:MAG TPA: hypothetical protein VJT73_14535, partial [Polyangiaceae bacterium]|nr:hypothetical protein [Polyangiaceae bacterium]